MKISKRGCPHVEIADAMAIYIQCSMKANAHFQYDVEARADAECGMNSDNDRGDDMNSLSEEDFSEYGEAEECTDESDSEEDSGTAGEAYDVGGIQTPMEGQRHFDEPEPSSMNVRDAIPFFNIGGGDGTIYFEAVLNDAMSNQHGAKELAKGMIFNTK